MKCSVMEVGNLCVFKNMHNRLADQKNSAIRLFSGKKGSSYISKSCRKLRKSGSSVLMVFKTSTLSIFTFDPTSSHAFCFLSNYICTLPSSSFETIESATTEKLHSIMSPNVER